MNHCNPDSPTKTHISSLTQNMSVKNSFLQKMHISSHPEHVFFHKGSHILSPKHAFFKGSSTENSYIFPHKPCLLSKTLPQKIHISSHTNHAFFQRLCHRKFTHPLTQHMSFYMSSFNETKAAYVKELPRKVNPV